MSDALNAAVVTQLEATSAVTDLVGSGSSARIYPDVLPQDPEYPALLVEITSNTSEEYIGGSAGLSHARVQLTACAATRAAADELAEAVRENALAAGHRGAWGSMTIRNCALEAGPFHGVVRPRDGSDRWIRLTRLDFVVSYKQTIPS